MFILKDGKLYIQKGNKIVGVNVDPLNVVEVEGSECELKLPYKTLEPFEMRSKFNITEGTGYVFPVENEEIIKSEVVEEPTAKTPTESEVVKEVVKEVMKPKNKGGRPSTKK